MHKNQSGTSKLVFVIIFFSIIFIAASVVGVLMDNSTRKAAPANVSGNTSTAPSSNLPDAAKAQAEASLPYIQNLLEEFFVNNNYYPGTLSESLLINQPGSIGSGNGSSMFTTPSGVHFVYVTQPNGCTTVNKNCKSFTLSAIQASNGAVITSVHS